MEERRTSGSTEKAPRPLERGLEPECFHPAPAASPRAASKPRTRDDLHVCPGCASGLVHPLAWQPVGRSRWKVSLRCPECEWRGAGTYGQAALERFDELLDGGIEELLEDLKVLARANLEEEIDRFAGALHADRILPEDF